MGDERFIFMFPTRPSFYLKLSVGGPAIVVAANGTTPAALAAVLISSAISSKLLKECASPGAVTRRRGA